MSEYSDGLRAGGAFHTADQKRHSKNVRLGQTHIRAGRPDMCLSQPDIFAVMFLLRRMKSASRPETIGIF